MQVASEVGGNSYLMTALNVLEQVINSSSNDIVLCDYIAELQTLTSDENFCLNAQKTAEFIQRLGEANFYRICKAHHFQLERVKETSESTPDFSLCGWDVFFEVKTLSVVTGNYELSKSLERSLEAQISIEDQLRQGRTVAMGESEVMPYGDKASNSGPISGVINTLLEKIRQNIKAGQYSQGPTFLVVDLSLIAPDRTDNLILRPAYADDYLFSKAVTGTLWHVAFGRPGAPILGNPEFEGAKCVESIMEKVGVLVDDKFQFVKGIIFVIHPWNKPAEVWSLERDSLHDELARTHPGLLDSLRQLVGNNWNDESDTNGFCLTG